MEESENSVLNSRIFSSWCVPRHVLVEEDSGADDELEDVLQGFHGLQQLFC